MCYLINSAILVLNYIWFFRFCLEIFYFRIMIFIKGILLLLSAVPPITQSALTKKSKNKLLLISFDGFRWDYLTKTNNTKNFDRIINNGVKAKWLEPNFASVTFPNHYSIVTGLFEESHGIIANTFYDPVLNKRFDYHNSTNVDDGAFFGGEPIWVTNQKQGGETGVYYWVGSEAEIQGMRPTKYEKYEMTGPDQWPNEVDSVINWLNVDDFNLALLYFPEPDHTGHMYGPESPEIVNMIEKCDQIVGYILNQFKKQGMLDDVNIIITSDHGMAEVDQNNRAVFLSPVINFTKSIDKIFNFHTGALIWPKEGEEDVVYNNVKNLSSHLFVWKKDEIPVSFHYKNNPRVSPIFVMAQDRWSIRNDNTTQEWETKGNHGYNNTIKDMHAIFMAMGPQFQKKMIVEPFNNVNIYSLLCQVLGITPAPNNGSIEATKHMLIAHPFIDDLFYGRSDYFYGVAKIIGLVFGALVVLIMWAFIVKQVRCSKLKYKTISYNELPLTDDDQSNLLMSTVRY